MSVNFTGAKARVLIVDHDAALLEDLRSSLIHYGFDVSVERSLNSGIEQVSTTKVDVVVTNVILPDGSGSDLLRAIRATAYVPVVFLKERGDAADRARGLEMGADDYLSKPFSSAELVARIRALVRRVHTALGVHATLSEAPSVSIRVGELTLFRQIRKAAYSGNDLDLTEVEFNLLEYLLCHCGSVVSRQELMRAGLGRKQGIFDRSVDVHLSRIRKKLKKAGGTAQQIKSIRGVGYILAAKCRDNSVAA
jgi:two-component system, OmpR family, response regulator